MAKIYYPEHIARIQGKVCRKDPDGITYMQRSDTGTKFVQHRHATMYNPTAAQLAVNAKFASAIAAVQAAMADPVQIAAYISAFKAQKKYKTLRGFVFAEEYAKL